MNVNNYKTIEVTLGNYKRRFEMRENYIGAFVVDNRVFNVVGSSHAIQRLEERQMDKYHVLSSLISLGDDLITYNDSGKHIIISNEEKECSVVFTIERWIVVIITVLDKGQMYTSSNANFEKTINLGSVG